MDMGEQFTYTPGFSPTSKAKPKPGKPQRQPGPQQGTLFKVNPSQRTPESRQPRGFSNQRWNEVGMATGLLHSYSDYEGVSHLKGSAVHAHPMHAQNVADTLSTIARSTVPVADLANLHVGAGYVNKPETKKGEYNRDSAMGPVASVYRDSGKDITPIHEIGHHVQAESGGAYWNGGHRSSSVQGETEGFADNYAQQHARTPGYKPQPVPVDAHPQDWHGYYDMRGNYSAQETFDAGYHMERGTGQYLNYDQFGFEARRASGNLPKEHIPGQVPLLHRTTSGWGDKAKTTWDYNHDVRNDRTSISLEG